MKNVGIHDMKRERRSGHNPLSLMKLYLFTNAIVVDDVVKFVSDESSYIEAELEKHKVVVVV